MRLIDCTIDGNISYGIVQPGQHQDDGIPIIRVNNVNNGQLDLTNALKVSPDIEDKYKRTRLKGGEVLLTLVGSTGQSCVAPPELAGWNVARAIAVIKVDEDVGNEWVNICLQSKEIKQFLNVRANTTVQKTLNLKDVKDIPILIPPKCVKEFIQQNTLSLDAKIVLNRQINQILEAMAQTIFKSWFVDFEPVKAKITAIETGEDDEGVTRAAMRAISGKTNDELDQMQAVRPENYAQLKTTAGLFPAAMQDSELGEVPEGWKIGTLGELCDIIMGQSPPGTTYNEIGDGLPFYQGITDFGFRFPSRRVYCTAPTRFAEDGDVLLSVRAPVGSLNVAKERCAIGRGVATLRLKGKQHGYLYYLLCTTQSGWNKFEAEGTVFGSVGKSDVHGFKVMIIPEYLRERFGSLVEPLDKQIAINEKQSKTLFTIRDALLPKLMTGDIRV